MRFKKTAIAIAILLSLGTIAAAVVYSQLPAIGAGALLFPTRRASMRATPGQCTERRFDGVNARLAGWVCAPQDDGGKPAILYLHGIADNRDSAIGVIDRFVPRGFSVIAYDSRGHGQSDGDRCTYGFFEKQDVSRVLDQAGVQRAIIIGHSLGAAVGLQAGAADRRIIGIVAASTFSDLRTIATERAPSVFTDSTIEAAFVRAEHDGQFMIDDASPRRAATAITVPVLLIHGALDRNTRPEHSERVFSALGGPKQLLIVPDAGHNDVLRNDVWVTIERWIDRLR